jgi:hypothetical protein
MNLTTEVVFFRHKPLDGNYVKENRTVVYTEETSNVAHTQNPFLPHISLQL